MARLRLLAWGWTGSRGSSRDHCSGPPRRRFECPGQLIELPGKHNRLVATEANIRAVRRQVQRATTGHGDTRRDNTDRPGPACARRQLSQAQLSQGRRGRLMPSALTRSCSLAARLKRPPILRLAPAASRLPTLLMARSPAVLSAPRLRSSASLRLIARGRPP